MSRTRVPEWERRSLVVQWAGYTEWPGERRREFEPCRFRATSSETVYELKEECARIGTRDVRVLVDAPAHAFRRDGQLAADARVGYCGVIVQVQHPDRGMLTFPCDTYAHLWDNLRAVVLTLGALRAIERYGAARERQYAGFAALPAMGQSTATLSARRAAATLTLYCDAITEDNVLEDVGAASTAAARSRSAAHPDRNGGDRRAWDDVELAIQRLSAHHGKEL
jgi:hypothetical protein